MKKNRILDWIFPSVDQDTQFLIDRYNVRNIHNISLFVGIIEGITALILLITSKGIVSGSYASLYSVSFCACFFIAIFFITKSLLRPGHKLEHIRTTLMIVAFIFIIDLWGMAASIRNYKLGKQMLTFYAVQVITICFVILPSYISWLLIIITYSILYTLLFLYDRAASILVANYAIFILVEAFGSSALYKIHLESFGYQARLDRLNVELKNSSDHDMLTTMLNRRALKSQFEQYYKKTVSVMMVDIDYFKRFNDEYGHRMGDKVLKQFSGLIIDNFGEENCFRIGGDEFLVIMPEYDIKAFEKLVHSWKEELKNMKIDGLVGSISCSIGYVSGKPEDDTQIRELIDIADRELYKDKNNRKKQEG